jgi:hypothetical protein
LSSLDPAAGAVPVNAGVGHHQGDGKSSAQRRHASVHATISISLDAFSSWPIIAESAVLTSQTRDSLAVGIVYTFAVHAKSFQPRTARRSRQNKTCMTSCTGNRESQPKIWNICVYSQFRGILAPPK